MYVIKIMYINGQNYFYHCTIVEKNTDGKACGDVIAEAGDIFFVIEGSIKNLDIEFQNQKLRFLMEVR